MKKLGKLDDFLLDIENDQPSMEADNNSNLPALLSSALKDKLIIAGVSAVLPFLLNGLVQAIATDADKANSIDTNIIDLTCIVSDDLPQSVRNQYCESLEVIYAYMVRSILSTNTYTRFSGNTRGILKSIPLLTSADRLKMVNNVLMEGTRLDAVVDGKGALAVFNESVAKQMEIKYRKLVSEVDCVPGLEADAIFKESRSSNGKYISVKIDVDGRSKEISLGVRVRPKVVSRSEMISFFVNKNTAVIEPDKVSKFSFLKTIKNLFNRKREIPKEIFDRKMVFSDLMRKVSGIKKPFVCMLISQNVADELKDEYKIDFESMNYAKHLYNNFPILSLGVYNTNADTITASLTPGAGFVSRAASAFNSEIASYEKQLAEMMRTRY